MSIICASLWQVTRVALSYIVSLRLTAESSGLRGFLMPPEINDIWAACRHPSPHQQPQQPTLEIGGDGNPNVEIWIMLDGRGLEISLRGGFPYCGQQLGSEHCRGIQERTLSDNLPFLGE